MSSLLGPAAQPKTKLGRHRQLSPLAGVHVSPLQLGGMSIGDAGAWAKHGLGPMDREKSFALLDAFYDAGGNFIDTANNYQQETSEMIIGEWAEQRGLRDQLVIATKFTTNFKMGQGEKYSQMSTFSGNNAKSLQVSVEASLKKLRTSYIDILYVHWWDWRTSVKEVMNSLHNLVVQGKVLYLGISDTPAWVVAQANTYADMAGKTPFSIYQGRWSVMLRDFEREIIPMTRTLGLALAPWDVLGGGKFRTDAEEEARRHTSDKGRTMFGPWERSENEKKISAALEKVAKEVGTEHVTAVALAYVMQKTPYVFPIVGGRKIEHLKGNIEALDIALTDEQIKYLEEALPFDPGFPSNFVGDGSSYNFLLANAGHFDLVPIPEAIRPIK